LAAARAGGERTGQLGEELVDVFFKTMMEAGDITDYEWVSLANAIAPYDFRVKWKAQEWMVLDVKSTRGDFDNPIHLSLGELVKSQQGPERYEIYRLYVVTERSAKLRVSKDATKLLRPILEAVTALPKGVSADGFSISTDFLSFDKEIAIDLDD
jgi:hypothetical protein